MLTMHSQELDRLRRVFEANRAQWIEAGHEGRWVAIGPDEQVVGFFSDYEAAYTEAAARFDGDKPFLLQEVLRQERVEQIQLLSWT